MFDASNRLQAGSYNRRPLYLGCFRWSRGPTTSGSTFEGIDTDERLQPADLRLSENAFRQSLALATAAYPPNAYAAIRESEACDCRPGAFHSKRPAHDRESTRPNMTATRRFILIACATLLASSSFAQIMTLSGEVTQVSGVLAGQYAPGDAVTLTFDLSAPLIDDTGGAFLPEAVSYFGRFSASIGGTALILPGPTDVFVVQYPDEEGLLVDAAWEADGDVPGARIFQAFTSEKNILDSFTYFPANLALSEFMNTAGFFANDNLNPTGRVDWEITSYTGFGGVPPFSAVPEPSTYAAFAAAGLCGVILLRRRQRVHATP